jgi:hypothetical protein
MECQTLQASNLAILQLQLCTATFVYHSFSFGSWTFKSHHTQYKYSEI